jgi:hypothetical protein
MRSQRCQLTFFTQDMIYICIQTLENKQEIKVKPESSRTATDLDTPSLSPIRRTIRVVQPNTRYSRI